MRKIKVTDGKKIEKNKFDSQAKSKTDHKTHKTNIHVNALWETLGWVLTDWTRSDKTN